jgi:hypothetical protein
MLRNRVLGVILAAAALPSLYLAGCSGKGASVPMNENQPVIGVNQPAAQNHAQKDEEEHAHKPGAHGGSIISLGRDSYHVEAVFVKGGTLQLYMLGQDETRVQDVESQELTAYAKAEGGNESIALPVKPQPQAGDAPGKTSQFIGQIPEDLQGQILTITIPSITIGGERFRLGFTSATESHSPDSIPAKVSDEAEAELYLTPGGIYTEADIKANSNITASQKFKGFRASHDLNPKPGDRICPITLTLANPKVTWIVDGKEHQFCCPPCVDEFLKLAKEKPGEVKDPAAYVKPAK